MTPPKPENNSLRATTAATLPPEIRAELASYGNGLGGPPRAPTPEEINNTPPEIRKWIRDTARRNAAEMNA